MNLKFLVIGIIVLFCIIGMLSFWVVQKNKIRKKNFRGKITQLLKKTSPLFTNQKILEYDKILDLCLKEKGLSGTTGEKMKKYGEKFLSQNDIWFAHKLRNRIAHEVGFTIPQKDFIKAEKVFMREIEELLK